MEFIARIDKHFNKYHVTRWNSNRDNTKGTSKFGKDSETIIYKSVNLLTNQKSYNRHYYDRLIYYINSN